MGAPVTGKTPLGKAATPVRKRVRALVVMVHEARPEAVSLTGHGGKGTLSVFGWLGQSLFIFNSQHPEFNVKWHDPYQPGHLLKRLTEGGAGGGHDKLRLISAWLPTIETELVQMVVGSQGRMLPVELAHPVPMATDHIAGPQRASHEATEAPETAAVDPEIAAIADVLEALRKVTSQDSRVRITDYVLDRLKSEEDSHAQ